jgi:hypothetical protein
MVIKTVKKIGYSTASPDKLGTLFFDFYLEHEGQKILSTFDSEKCLYDSESKKINAHIKFGEAFYLDKKCHSTRLNEYRWSLLFENVLKTMKKFEFAEISVLATEQFSESGLISKPKEKGLERMFSWGKDFEKAKKVIEKFHNKKYEEVLEECILIYF